MIRLRTGCTPKKVSCAGYLNSNILNLFYLLEARAIRTLQKYRLSPEEIDEILQKTENRFYDRITTKKILAILHEEIEHSQVHFKKSDLRAALGAMRSAPDFEVYVQKLFRGLEYDVTTNRVIQGHCARDKANPGSLILSATMILRYLGWNEAAELGEKALGKTILAKTVTYDLERLMDDATLVPTSKFGELGLRTCVDGYTVYSSLFPISFPILCTRPMICARRQSDLKPYYLPCSTNL